MARPGQSGLHAQQLMQAGGRHNRAYFYCSRNTVFHQRRRCDQLVPETGRRRAAQQPRVLAERKRVVGRQLGSRAQQLRGHGGRLRAIETILAKFCGRS